MFCLLLQLRLQVSNLCKKNLWQTEILFTNLSTIHSPVSVDILGYHNLRNRFFRICNKDVMITITIIKAILLVYQPHRVFYRWGSGEI